MLFLAVVMMPIIRLHDTLGMRVVTTGNRQKSHLEFRANSFGFRNDIRFFHNPYS